jgi:predicted nucleotidyltransferase
MNFGLASEEFALLTALVLEPLKKQNAKVWIFGSRARGDQKKFSDIDILFELPAGKTLGTTLGCIKEQIEESRLPFKVDLVEWSSLAESYKHQVVIERKEI